MQAKQPLNRVILNNLAWFLGSLGLAFLVWIIATVQLNPVEERRVPGTVAIRVVPDDGLVVTNTSALSRTATVQARAQRSVWDFISTDDIVIRADLAGLGPGEHTVTLQADVARPARIVDIAPRQITVELEEIASKLVEVRAEIVDEPPFGYEMIGDVQLDVNQVTVSGPRSKVEQVAAVQVPIDLSGERRPLEDFARPVPVDADGNPVTDVTVDTQVVGISVDIQPTS